jgi:glycerol-3-phosphate dehydrogenase
MLPSRVDLLIIGAGVVGAALAREISRFDLRVLLLEKEVDVSFGTSKTNSGIVHSGIHDHPGTLKARFCVEGNRLFSTLAEELDLLYKNNGSLVVARSSEELPLLEELRHSGLVNGVTGLAVLGREELLRLEPNLSPDLEGGLLAPSGGTIAPFDLVFALVENAVANGVTLSLSTEVLGIEPGREDFLVKTNRGPVRARYLVNAAGVLSGQIARLIGDESFKIFPVKGEEYLLDRKLEGLVRRAVFPLPSRISKGILVIPTVDGNIMVGPTAHQVESYAESSTSAAGWEEIFQEVSALVPSLRRTDVITSFAGLRATSDREDFIISQSAFQPRFINAAGIKSPGLTAAPAIARYLVELLEESGLGLVRRSDFNPRRPLIRLRQLGREAQSRLMAEDPSYAKIVCRCEVVSEGEIRAAIRRGATTLDGVKLRTRAGMGRCQGGFCTPKIMKILGEELGISPEEVTKKGPGSFLVAGRLRETRGGAGHA